MKLEEIREVAKSKSSAVYMEHKNQMTFMENFFRSYYNYVVKAIESLDSEIIDSIFSKYRVKEFDGIEYTGKVVYLSHNNSEIRVEVLYEDEFIYEESIGINSIFENYNMHLEIGVADYFADTVVFSSDTFSNTKNENYEFLKNVEKFADELFGEYLEEVFFEDNFFRIEIKSNWFIKN